LQLHRNETSHILSPWSLLNNTIPFTISLLLPRPFLRGLPLSVHVPFPFSLSIRYSVPFPCLFLAAWRLLSTLAIVIVIAIARAAPSPTWRSGIHPVVIISILVDYLIPMQWSSGQAVAWLVLPAACQQNHCSQSIATVPRELLASALNHPQAGCLLIEMIDLIREGTGVVPPPIGHSVIGSVEPKAAHHSQTGEQMFLWCWNICWIWDTWRVMTRSREIIQQSRCHAISSLTLEMLYID
jgi:hypothetical protein